MGKKKHYLGKNLTRRQAWTKLAKKTRSKPKPFTYSKATGYGALK